MKNIFKFLGIIALVAVIGFSMAACSGGGGGAPDLPENATTAAALPNFKSPFVGDEGDIFALLNDSLGEWSTGYAIENIREADRTITGKTLGVKYTPSTADYTNGYFDDKDIAAFLAPYLGEKEAEFKAEYTGATYTYYPDDGDKTYYTKVTLDGSVEREFSSNVVLGKRYDWSCHNNPNWDWDKHPYWGNAGKNITVGDWEDGSSSFEKKFAVRYVTGEAVDGTYTSLVEGKIVTEGNSSWRNEIVKAPQYDNAGNYLKREDAISKYSEDYTVAVALTIDNGYRGAKIIFTFAKDNSGATFDPRAGEVTNGASWSSVEVYNNANEKKFDIQLDDIEKWAGPIYWNLIWNAPF